MFRHACTALVCLTALTLATPAGAQSEDELAERMLDAADVYRTLMEAPDAGVPLGLLEGARCVAVIPQVVKAAIVWGGRFGRGVASCRDQQGRWSPPVFVRLTGGSWGFQIGAQSADFVLFFMSEAGARSLLESRFTLGADASIAAGPLGRAAEASTDLALASEIYSYARTRGMFAGISFEGAHFTPEDAAIASYYGRRHAPAALLFGGRLAQLPSSAYVFLNTLPAPPGI
jgi:lipid-binding SYLF domain-containing protein